MTRKLTALLLCLILLCSIAVAEESGVTGTWYLSAMAAGETTVNAADMGIDMELTLNEDGTGSSRYAGADPLEAVWTLEGTALTVTANETPIVFEVTQDGTLVNTDEENGASMIFSREKPTASYVPAAEVAATDLTQFDGRWTAEMANVYGVLMPFENVASMGFTDGAIVIENGAVTKFGEEEVETGTLEDGILVIHSTTENDENNLFGATVTLLEDGSIKVIYLGIIFYCGPSPQSTAAALE